MTSYKSGEVSLKKRIHYSLLGLFLILVPVLLGYFILNLWSWDFSVPLAYGNPGADEIWQLVSTKTLLETGWVLENPQMGAPSISTWYGNSASQISVIHSLMMLVIAVFEKDSIAVQQYYFMMNFALISIATYCLARALKINVLIAIAIGIVFSLTSYRINSLFFAYLANYFMVPISLIPIYWIFEGKYQFKSYRDALLNRYLFYLGTGAAISIITAVSDGYYSFFYLLLLGFAVLCRCVNGDVFFPKNLLAPLIFITLTIGTSLGVTTPLREHRANYPHEASQDKMKQPTDAEVYTPTLKLLITPLQNHRLELMRNISSQLITTANFNRRFPYVSGAPVVLGTFGSLLLFCSLIYLSMRQMNFSSNAETLPRTHGLSVAYTSSLLSLFILLCSVTGGLGTLIALGYSSIRAYERFPIFLILVLYIGVGSVASTYYLRSNYSKKAMLLVLLVVLTTTLIVLDQTQSDQLGLRNADGIRSRSERFLAEREFIADIENILPDEAMVYQYPFSQYLTDNRYYGWGQFGQLRAYLHSKKLRWSNGAAKDSYVDKWHEKKSTLPTDLLVPEMQAAGFDGILVDRLVVKDDEYNILRDKLNSITGESPIVNDKARMAFWKLPKLPFVLKYDEEFQEGHVIKILSKFESKDVVLPKIINPTALNRLLSVYGGEYPFDIESDKNPEVFLKSIDVDQGLGWTKIDNSLIRGGVDCNSDRPRKLKASSEVDFVVDNKSSFDWRFDAGNFPLRVGLMFRDSDGKFLMDASIKVNKYLRSNESLKLKANFAEIVSASNKAIPDHYFVSIKLLQDGNRWFDGEKKYQCTLEITP